MSTHLGEKAMDATTLASAVTLIGSFSAATAVVVIPLTLRNRLRG